MRRATGTALLVALCASLARVAHAQPAPSAPPASPPAAASTPASSTSLVVLTLDSEDRADQAEALSGALRSRVRKAPHMSLVETETSFAMFTGALACPAKPDAPCLQKIAQKLKVDRFVWGTLAAAGPGQVSAEVHLWDHGKDTSHRETFSDNLRDQNDEVLRRIAERILGALTGGSVATFVSVHALGSGDAAGTLRLDGADAGALEHGAATLELAAGDHVIEARVPGFRVERRRVHATPGKDLNLEISFEREAAPKVEEPSKPISARTILALSSLGVGLGFGVAGTVEAVRFLSHQSTNQDDHKAFYAADFCDKSQPHVGTDAQMNAACDNLKSGQNARVLEGVFYGVSAVFIGVGAVLLVTDHSSPGDEKAARAPAAPRVSVTPYAGPREGGFAMSLVY